MIKFYSGAYSTLSLKVRDLITNDILVEYSYPTDPQILHGAGDYFVDYTPPAKDLVFEVTTPDGTESIQRGFTVKDPQGAASVASLFLSWTESMAYSWPGASSEDTYEIGYTKKDTSTSYHSYVPGIYTNSYTDFSNFALTPSQFYTAEFYDNNSSVFWKAYGLAAPTDSTDFSGFDNMACVYLGTGSLQSINLYANSSQGVTFGFCYQDLIKFASDSITLTIADNGDATLTVTDGIRSATEYLSCAVTGAIHSLFITADLKEVNVFTDTSVLFSMDLKEVGFPEDTTLYFSELTLSDGHLVKDFFYQTNAMTLEDVQNTFIADEPVVITSTSYTEAIVSFDAFPSNLEDYWIFVQGLDVKGQKTLRRQYDYRDVPTIRGKHCFIWGRLDTDYQARQGIYFNVHLHDQVTATTYPTKNALINARGLYGVYLPVGAIYTARIIDEHRTFKFCVPDKASALFDELVDFDRPYLKEGWRKNNV